MGTCDQVDWDAFARAMNRMQPSQQWWASKQQLTSFLTDKTWNSGNYEARTCHQSPETHNHIFWCQAPEAASTRKTGKLDERNKNVPHNTASNFSRSSQLAENQVATNYTTTTVAAQEQANLGWHLALEEVISEKWQEEQVAVWKAFKSRKSNRRWTTALIQCLVDTDMWHHRNEALHESWYNQ